MNISMVKGWGPIIGISGILTNEYVWRCSGDESKNRRGVQIDLLIERSDGIIDICEMKYCKEPFVISTDYGRELRRKRDILAEATGTKSAVHTVMVTTEGVARNEEWGEIQAEITLDNLFEL